MKIFLKKFTALALLCVITLTALASCTVTKKYPGAPDGMRPVNDGSNGVIMYIPNNWSVDTSCGIPTAYFSYTDRTTVTLTSVPADELNGKSIQEYFKEYQEKFNATVSDFELLHIFSAELDYTPVQNPLNLEMYEYQYKFKISDSKTYRFAQTFFKTSENSDVYIITYSTTDDKFETHYSDVVEAYANLKLVNEPVPLPDNELPPPIFTEVEGTPDGYSAITGEHINYVLFVPSDWTPIVNTGISAASKGSDPTVSCSITGFNPVNDDNFIDGADYDRFFEATEQTLLATFGNLTFANPESKYTRVDFAGKTAMTQNASGEEIVNETAARKYVYSINVDGVDYTYEQYVVFHNGYVYILTLSCKTAQYAENSAVFNGIASNFKFTK